MLQSYEFQLDNQHPEFHLPSDNEENVSNKTTVVANLDRRQSSLLRKDAYEFFGNHWYFEEIGFTFQHTFSIITG